MRAGERAYGAAELPLARAAVPSAAIARVLTYAQALRARRKSNEALRSLAMGKWPDLAARWRESPGGAATGSNQMREKGKGGMD